MTPEWEEHQAVRMLGNFLATLDKLELADWDLWILQAKKWSVYAIRKP